MGWSAWQERGRQSGAPPTCPLPRPCPTLFLAFPSWGPRKPPSEQVARSRPSADLPSSILPASVRPSPPGRGKTPTGRPGSAAPKREHGGGEERLWTNISSFADAIPTSHWGVFPLSRDCLFQFGDAGGGAWTTPRRVGDVMSRRNTPLRLEGRDVGREGGFSAVRDCLRYLHGPEIAPGPRPVYLSGVLDVVRDRGRQDTFGAPKCWWDVGGCVAAEGGGI